MNPSPALIFFMTSINHKDFIFQMNSIEYGECLNQLAVYFENEVTQSDLKQYKSKFKVWKFHAFIELKNRNVANTFFERYPFVLSIIAVSGQLDSKLIQDLPASKPAIKRKR